MTHLQPFVNAAEITSYDSFKFVAHKCKGFHFTASRTRVETPKSKESLWGCCGILTSFSGRVSLEEAQNLVRVDAQTKWNRNQNTTAQSLLKLIWVDEREGNAALIKRHYLTGSYKTNHQLSIRLHKNNTSVNTEDAYLSRLS